MINVFEEPTLPNIDELKNCVSTVTWRIKYEKNKMNDIIAVIRAEIRM